MTTGEPRPRYVLSWDCGKRMDASALTLLRHGLTGPRCLRVVSCETFPMGKSYDSQAKHVLRMVASIVEATPDAELVLVIDRGQAGDAVTEVVNVLRRKLPAGDARRGGRVLSLQITSGEHSTGSAHGTEVNVPKTLLLKTTEVSLSRGLVSISPTVNPGLLAELADLEVIAENPTTGRIRFGAPSGSHDDQALAVLMAIWTATKLWSPEGISSISTAAGLPAIPTKATPSTARSRPPMTRKGANVAFRGGSRPTAASVYFPGGARQV